MTEYRRYQGKSYMVWSGEATVAGYEYPMLTENRIGGLLPLRIANADEQIQFWYDISGMHSLESWVKIRKPGEDFLKRFMTALAAASEQAGEYLLCEDGISLLPDRIFLNSDEKEMLFCYMPFEKVNFADGLRGFMEYYLSHMEHGKGENVQKCYAVYEKCQKEHITVEELLQVLFEETEEEVPLQEEMPEESVERKFFGKEIAEKTADRKLFGREMAEKTADRKLLGKEIREKIVDRNVSGKETREKMVGRKVSNKETEEKTVTRKLFGRETAEKDGLHKSQESKWGDLLENIKNIKMLPKKKKVPEVSYVFEPEEYQAEASNPTVFLGSETARIIGEFRYEGDGVQENLRISGSVYLVGNQKEEVQGMICDETVSRIHAKITVEDGKYYIEDMNSTNGTYRNGELLNYMEKVQLEKNDKIMFAKEVYRFV